MGAGKKTEHLLEEKNVLHGTYVLTENVKYFHRKAVLESFVIACRDPIMACESRMTTAYTVYLPSASGMTCPLAFKPELINVTIVLFCLLEFFFLD